MFSHNVLLTRTNFINKQLPRLLSLKWKVAVIVAFLAFLCYYYHNTTHPKTPSSQVASSKLHIPSCDRAPWKQLENLIGSCPGSLKPHAIHVIADKISTSAVVMIDQCSVDCCESDECVTWQYRDDVGCLHGGDVRLGMEKDGPGDWCSDHSPRKWQGQRLVSEKLKDESEESIKMTSRDAACSLKTWQPNERPGQCFGLGDMRIRKVPAGDGSVSPLHYDDAESCMKACCNDPDCGAWQFADDLGCFYNSDMHGCVNTTDPIVFEKFIGRRKIVESRTYVDENDRPWTQARPLR